MTESGAAPTDLDPRRWIALAVCVSALFMTLLDASIVNVALPSIGHTLHAGPSQLQWLVSGYLLTFGMVPIIGGRLGDDRGRRTMLLVGIAGFVLTSLLVGLAPNIGVLIAGRLLQGLSGGLINPQVSGLVQQLFPLRERGRAFGTLGAAVGIATAAGPVVGGLILAAGGTHLGWRLTFLINVPVGITSFVLCLRLLPATPRKANPRMLDLPGAALLTGGVFCVLFPTVQYDATRNALLVLFAVPAAVLLGGFLYWERGPALRRGHPLMDLRLFRIRSYADGLGLALLYFCGYTGMPLVLALFLQDGLGFSPLASGLTASSYAIGTGISAPIAGRLLPRFGRRLLIAALGVFAAGITIAATVAQISAGSVAPHTMAWLLVGPLLLAGFGGGSVITPNQALSLEEIDARGGSTAGGTLQTAQRVGAAIGTAVLGAVFYAAARGSAASGAARRSDYGHAYAVSLYVGIVFVAAALAIALHEARTATRRAAVTV